MIGTMANLWRIKEIRSKIMITLLMLGIYRLGTFIPLAGVDGHALKAYYEGMVSDAGGTATLTRMLSLFSGGAMFRFSVFALGIMPYISASIIMQILVAVTPSLKAIQEEGPAGQERIKLFTKFAAIVISIIQGIMFLGFLNNINRGLEEPVIVSAGLWWNIQTIATWTAGTLFLMWMGDQISVHGIGNGSSLIIMSGIVVQLPVAIISLLSPDTAGIQRDPLSSLVILVVYFLMIVGIVFITMAQRRVPIQMAKHVRGNRMSQGGAMRSYLPLRVNQAGVMPVIFASVVLQFSGVLFNYLADLNGFIFNPIKDQINPGAHFGYVMVNITLIIFFAYFYTAMVFNPKEMSENLKKQGHFIPGIRPGGHTADFLESLMNRVVLAGAVFLALIDVTPVLATGSGVQSVVAQFMGGTGLLIVVGVALDLMQKLETEMTMRNYQGFMRQRRGRRMGA